MFKIRKLEISNLIQNNIFFSSEDHTSDDITHPKRRVPTDWKSQEKKNQSKVWHNNILSFISLLVFFLFNLTNQNPQFHLPKSPISQPNHNPKTLISSIDVGCFVSSVMLRCLRMQRLHVRRFKHQPSFRKDRLLRSLRSFPRRCLDAPWSRCSSHGIYPL